MSLEAFLTARRSVMVRYAHGILTRGVGGTCAWGMADDVVQQAALYYLERQARGLEPEWSEARFVGAVRFEALKMSAAANAVVETRNTADDHEVTRRRGARGRKRRARVTSTWPSQVFGCGLAEAGAGASDSNPSKARKA